MQRIICFDFGGTKIAMAVIEMEAEKYDFLDLKNVANPRESEGIKKIISDYCQRQSEEYDTKKVSISSAKIVDDEKKVVFQAEEIYGEEEFDFGFLLEKGFDLRIENDGRCFGLGEYHFGKGRNTKSLLAITLGTDMGGGFLIEGKNYRGAFNASLEMSHMKFIENKQSVLWRDLAGGRAIENDYNKRAKAGIVTKDIFELAEKGDELAKEIIARAEFFVGVGLANLVTILDPQRIVIGGSLAFQEKYIGDIFKIARENVFNKNAKYEWEISDLKEKANLLGAGSLWMG